MLNMEYIDERRVMFYYDFFFNEVVYDFFDVLKLRIRGYGFFDYEVKGYVVFIFVKFDILINKE